MTPVNEIHHKGISERLENRIARLKRRHERLENISNRYWKARRIIFICGVLLAPLLCNYSGGTAGILLAGSLLIAFCVVAVFHQKIRAGITKNSHIIHLKQIQIARIELDWDNLPIPEKASPDTGHPFESDLDIFGEKSLLRVVDTTVTRQGSLRLASWLSNTSPDFPVIKKRQLLVQELKEFPLFRENLSLYSSVAKEDLKGRWDTSVLGGLPKDPVRVVSMLWTLRVLVALAALNFILATLSLLEVIPKIWPVTFAVYIGVMVFSQGLISTTWGDWKEIEKVLRKLRVVFQYLESRQHKNRPHLAAICSPFLDQHNRPSATLARVEKIALALGLRTNALIWLIVHVLVPWDFYFTYRFEHVKKDFTQKLPIWLDTWYEIEALNSLANFAYLNPDYVFPEISVESPRFDALALGHPLIKPDLKVCNDVVIQQPARIIILTGSNMAGKSTLIKTIGINLCLTYAGAPVNAKRLTTSLFRVFTCIKVSDSVHDGLSYFYAEVKRLKALLIAVNLDGFVPVLFLIDEIYRGTNNRERHIGSRALIKSLLSQRKAAGAIATHDLELTSLADEIPGIVNMHLREEVLDGEIAFDYQLRSGPCPTTNALKIMQHEGLPT